MIYRNHHIEVGSYKDVFTLIPAGDFQLGASGVRADKLSALAARIRHLGRRGLTVGMGDYCLPLDAEILTRRGFKKHTELILGEEVLAYDPQRECTCWTPLRRVVRFRRQPLVCLRSKSFVMVCTPDHRWYGTVGTGRWRHNAVAQANALPASFRIKIAAPVQDTQVSEISPASAALLGWLVTDGCQTKDGRFSISQTSKKYLTELIDLTATFATAIYRPSTNAISIINLSRPKMRQWMAEIGYRQKTDLPEIVTHLSSDARKAMLEAMLKAEGTYEFNRHTSAWRFAQKPGPVLDAFKILCTLEGIRLGKDNLRTWGVATPRLLRRQMVTASELKITPIEDGAVWCPTTDYGTWIAKRGDQITITGNCDIFRPSVEAKMTGALGADPDAQEQYDQLHKAHMRGIAEQLRPIFLPGQCLGLLSGHHAERVYTDGITGTQYLCQLLNVPYLGTMAMIRIRFLVGNRAKMTKTAKSVPVIVHAHHGAGSTQTIGADLNKIESKIAPHWEADIYLRGHSTKVGGVHLPPRTHMSETDPPIGIQRDRVMLNTGGYLDGYVDGKTSYVEKSAMIPAHLGWGEVLIHIHTKRVGKHCFCGFSLTVTS